MEDKTLLLLLTSDPGLPTLSSGQTTEWMSEKSWVGFPADARNFLFSKLSKLTLEPTQPPIQKVPVLFPLRVKRLGIDLTAYLHLGPRLRINGVTSPLPQIPS
jgi:hypothetical protein